MKKDRRIAGLYILVGFFVIGALLFLTQAGWIWGAGVDNGKENVAENVENQENTLSQTVVKKEEVAESVSMEQFEQLFTGQGDVKSKSLVIEGVPVVMVYSDYPGSMPLVVMQHGLESKKEEIAELANSFAMQGYVVICPDAAGHGELEDGSKRSLEELILGTAENFDKVISFVSQSEHIDGERVGLCGVSLGGLTSLYYASEHGENIDVVVSFCGTPDFSSFAGQSTVQCYYLNHEYIVENDKEKLKDMEEGMISMSPYDKLLKDSDIALFLMCGAQDKIVPPEGNVTFYKEALAAGRNVGLVVKDNQGHNVELDEMYAALAFMVENL